MDHLLFSSDTSGMWECPDFYPLPIDNTTDNAENVYVLKASTKGRDYWATVWKKYIYNKIQGECEVCAMRTGTCLYCVVLYVCV